MPTTLARVTLSEAPEGGTTMAIETTFSSLEAMEELVAMGMDDGIAAALCQIDEILAS